jgi:hypothetical protein
MAHLLLMQQTRGKLDPNSCAENSNRGDFYLTEDLSC